MPDASLPLTLVADVGGTNARVALAQGDAVIAETVQHYQNAGFASLHDVLRRFLTETGAKPVGACVAMAGPVTDGVARLTNLDWSMDQSGLAELTGAREVSILNDLQAQAHALGHLPDGGTRQLRRAANGTETGTMMVIGIGTGFNIAPVFQHGAERVVPPAEAGHALLPLRSVDDIDLAKWMAHENGVTSVEDMLSGRAIAAVHRYVCGKAGVPADMTGREVIRAAKRGDSAEARQTVDLMTGALARVASDLAITLLPVGGIYLAGGVARALADYVATPVFETAFRDKGRFSSFMDQFAIHVIEDDNAALTGCAAHIAQRLKV